ncbi:MAG: phytoene desaturase family protein [Hyphomicrobiaceae bacterium]
MSRPQSLRLCVGLSRSCLGYPRSDLDLRKCETAMSRPAIAIIGGGLAGQIAALSVTRSGGRAVLFEATSRLGGRAQTQVVDGFCLNQGPHALYLGGALHAALREFGVEVTGRGPDLANALALWNGQTHRFPLRQAEHAVQPLDVSETAALRMFFQEMSANSQLGRGVGLQDVLAPLPSKVRVIVNALVRLSTYIHAPADVDGKAALDQLRLSSAGTIYVDGGWRVLVDGLSNAMIKAGVVINTGESVVRVTSQGGACRVALRGDRTQNYAATILALSPKSAANVLATSGVLGAVAATARPVRLMSLDLALSGLSTAAANFALGFDEPTYLSVHSAASTLAPQGGAVVHVARYLAPDEPPTRNHFAEIESVADTLHPGWRTHVVHERRLSGAIVAHDFPRWTNAGQRAAGCVSDTPGVFLAGDWVGHVGMLADAAAASSGAAATAALEFARDVSTVPG